MSQFTGLCSYPHGGYITGGLIMATSSALTATIYAIASCRFAVLTFLSQEGNFEDSFAHNKNGEIYTTATTKSVVQQFDAVQGATAAATGNNLRMYKASIGLFQWLRPVSDVEWTEGSCVGYQQTMLAAFSEQTFEMARGFAVLAVVLAIVVTLWSFLSACLSWNVCQLVLLVFLLVCGTLASTMTFLFFQSDVCNNTLETSSCTLDEGGMVLIAGVILWFAALLIVVIFVRPPSLVAWQQEEREKDRIDEHLRQLRETAVRAQEQNLREKRLRKDKNSNANNAGRVPSAAGMVVATSTSPSAMRSPNRATPHHPASSKATSKNYAGGYTESRKVSTPRTASSSPTSSSSSSPVVAATSYDSYDSYDSVNSFQNRQRGRQFLAQEHQRQREQQKQQQARRYRSASAAVPRAGLVTHEPTNHNKQHPYAKSAPRTTALRQASKRTTSTQCPGSSTTSAAARQQQFQQQQRQQLRQLSSSAGAVQQPLDRSRGSSHQTAAAVRAMSGPARVTSTARGTPSQQHPAAAAAAAVSSQRRQESCSSSRQYRRHAGLTVDDVTSHQELEVYLSEKMQNIDDLILDLEKGNDDESSSDDGTGRRSI